MPQRPPIDPEEAGRTAGAGRPSLLRALGPGLITGASDDDPSGIATYAQAGAAFGYGLAWTMLFSYPLMVAIQMVSARIGRVTGHGIAGLLRLHYPRWLLDTVVMLLLVANVINLGADLGAMADALALVVPAAHALPRALYVAGLCALCVGLQVMLRYAHYVRVLKWLSLALLAYVATAIVVPVHWASVARGLLVPHWPASGAEFTTLVAIFGTTISPYLFFWQAAGEVEGLTVHPRRINLLGAPAQGRAALRRIRTDTLAGMAYSNLVALIILVTTAATLNVHGITDIATSAQAAQALRPIAGRFAELTFALGIVGTGLLAIPVLAGSAAYAIGEARHWPTGLARRPREARAFYITLVAATVTGAAINLTPIDPIRALFWSAVLNGIVAVPVMAVMMLITARGDIMGAFAVRGPLRWLGWGATAAMAAVVIAMAV